MTKVTNPENNNESVLVRASEDEFKSWNRYGEFTDDELRGSQVAPVERLAPNVAAWDKVLSKLLRELK